MAAVYRRFDKQYMQVNEIVSYPSRDGNIGKFKHYFTNVKLSPAFSDLTFGLANNHGTEIYGLFNEDTELVSVIELDERDTPYWQISYTETLPNYRRQGCFRYLLLKAVENHTTILSDEHQTNEAENAWKSLIQYPSERLRFKMYHTKTGDIEDIDQSMVWNDSSIYVMMVTNSHFTESMKHQSEIRDKFTTKNNRHFEGLWFGPDSSNQDYNNP